MSTWTRQQINDVSRLYVSGWIDDYYFHAGADVVSLFREQLARKLMAEAHVFAVEVHMADVAFRNTVDDDKHATRIDAYWSPTVCTVELRGGANDGEVWEVQNPHEPIRVAVQPVIEWASMTADPQHVAMAHEVLTYEQVGWREDERRWVFATDAR